MSRRPGAEPPDTGRRRSRLLLAVLVVVCLVLVTLDYRGGAGVVGRARDVVGAAFGPVERGVATVAGPVGRLVSRLGGGDSGQAARLATENARLRGQLRREADVERQLAARDRLLHLADAGRFRLVAAHVVGLGDALGLEDTAVLDRGASAGLAVGQTVTDGDGLVGRVETVSAGTATVLLAEDPLFAAGARMAQSGVLGVLHGTGRGRPARLVLQHPGDTVRVGEPLVTGAPGSGTSFAPGIPIGRVRALLSGEQGPTASAEVDLYSRLGRLDVVGVVVGGPPADPGITLLPTVAARQP